MTTMRDANILTGYLTETLVRIGAPQGPVNDAVDMDLLQVDVGEFLARNADVLSHVPVAEALPYDADLIATLCRAESLASREGGLLDLGHLDRALRGEGQADAPASGFVATSNAVGEILDEAESLAFREGARAIRLAHVTTVIDDGSEYPQTHAA